jgi:hypothetical protein
MKKNQNQVLVFEKKKNYFLKSPDFYDKFQ